MPKHSEDTNINKIPATSPDLRKDMLEKIREVYPALFGEGNSLNAKELQSLVDDYSKPEAERYSFPWAGKTASKRFAFTPSKARLVPDKERSVDFDTTQNLIIEGENLEVLKLLQASYFKKVKMIYIDPPYNTGHDFVYPDDYSESKQAYWEKNGVFHDGVRMDTNTESSGRYHSNWLSMMQSRLLLARNLLQDDGVIFVSIDDNEVHNLRKLMDEIFGEENFIDSLIWKKRYGGGAKEKYYVTLHEYILVYAKNVELIDDIMVSLDEESINRYYTLTDKENNPRGPFRTHPLEATKSMGDRPNLVFPIKAPDGSLIQPKRQWLWSKERVEQAIKENELHFTKVGDVWSVHTKQYLKDKEGNVRLGKMQSIIDDVFQQHGTNEILDLFGNAQIFSFPKPSKLIKKILDFSGKEDLILDFFAGSGTAAQAVMELNKEDGGHRKFILVQLPEATDESSEAFKAGFKTISQITIERVKRSAKKLNDDNASLLESYQGIFGFRVMKLSKSLFPQNMFEIDPDMTEAQKVKSWEVYLEKSKQSHLFDFKLDELLVEIALKDGFDLNFKSEPIKAFKKNKVFDISDGEKTALVCLDENIQEDTIKDLEPYKERRFICLERAVDSTRKWNLKRMFGDNLWVA